MVQLVRWEKQENIEVSLPPCLEGKTEKNTHTSVALNVFEQRSL